MGLLADEFKQLKQMAKDFAAEKITAEQVRVQVSILKESHKRADLILKMYIACNNPHLVEKRLHSLNLITKGEFVQSVGEIELEMIMCPDQDKAITREVCLSYSGDAKNLSTCQSCENFAITRKLLLDRERKGE